MVLLIVQILNTCEKFCLYALMIAINVSLSICQYDNCLHLEKNKY